MANKFVKLSQLSIVKSYVDQQDENLVDSLATVAKTGDYADLTNKPVIPVMPSPGSSASAVASTASGGSSDAWSRADHVHNIVVGSGDAAGQVKIAGQNASVNGWSGKADLASPAFTGTPTAPTAAAETSTTQLATTAFVVTEVNNKIAASQALIFKGTVDSTHPLPTSGVKIGWTYVVAAAGTYAGHVCEIGDMLIAQTTTPTWVAIQKNIDGAVIGPASAVSDHVATFNGATGKLIKDSGYTIATSVPSGAVFTDTTYTFAEGSTNGAFSVTPSGGSAQSVSVHGLGSAAYTASTDYATAAQGTLATNAVRAVVAGTNNGQVKVTTGTGSATDVTVYTHPTATATAAAAKKVGCDASGHVVLGAALTASDVGALSTSTTYAGSSSVGGAANSVANSLTLKFDTGTTEGTNLYTFNGSAAKTVDIKAGSNVTLTKAAGSVTIAATDTVYTHPAGSAASQAVGLYKFSTDSTSHIASATAATTADITALVDAATDEEVNDIFFTTHQTIVPVAGVYTMSEAPVAVGENIIISGS